MIAHMNLQANLVDPFSMTSFWNGKFRSTFVQPPVGRKGFNDETVDALLNNLLDQLAKDGMVPSKVH